MAATLVAVAGCTTVRPLETRATPLAKGLELQLPRTPGYPERANLTQTVVGQYGERRAAFQAILTLSPAEADIVLTAPSGPRILSIRWTEKGIFEDRTLLAPAELKGLNVLGDIFLSLWPVAQVQAALPDGASVVEDAAGRVVRASDRELVRVEPLERQGAQERQKLTNIDFGYSLTIITDRGG